MPLPPSANSVQPQQPPPVPARATPSSHQPPPEDVVAKQQQQPAEPVVKKDAEPFVPPRMVSVGKNKSTLLFHFGNYVDISMPSNPRH